MFTYKVVKDVAKNVFKVKKIDENGSSLGTFDEFFYAEADAQAFAEKLANGEGDKAPEAGAGNVTAGGADAKKASDGDRILEISKVEFESGADGAPGKTNFCAVEYLLEPDGHKVVKTTENHSFDGELTVEQVIEKAQAELVEKGWVMKVVWAEETTVEAAA